MPGFPLTREWWNPEDWKEATEIAASIAEDTSFTNVPLPTGTGFFLRACARFPQIQLLHLRHRSTSWARKGGQPLVIPDPGLGWDIRLQRFTLAPQTELDGAFAEATREEENLPLVTVKYRCSKGGCTKYVLFSCCLTVFIARFLFLSSFFIFS